EYVCKLHRIPRDHIKDLQEAFENVDGKILVTLNLEDFQLKTANYGEMLHNVFKNMCSNVPVSKYPAIDEIDTPKNLTEECSNLPSKENELENQLGKTILNPQHHSRWSSKEVGEVLQHLCGKHKIPNDRTIKIVKQFVGVTGIQLKKMSRQEFREKAMTDGDLLFHGLSQLFDISTK
ncbi:hypothetical protein AM593_10494, partial [Mytilus galloprovincialis]